MCWVGPVSIPTEPSDRFLDCGCQYMCLGSQMGLLAYICGCDLNMLSQYGRFAVITSPDIRLEYYFEHLC